MTQNTNTLVYTIKERCRVCYTCVRECPAKAIKIVNGQAEVISERCIGCGNCVKVCSQGAKVYRNSIDKVLDIIESGNKVAACIAPSFPAEFNDICNFRVFVGMVRAVGFHYVNEVAFGADIVALKYKQLLENDKGKHYISSDCPSIVSYVEHYYPNLIENIAPIVSPMVATARVLRKMHGDDLKIVFIGPCIAKKDESTEIDASLTFKELREIFELKKISGKTTEVSDFDLPHGGKGAIFPVSRGLIQTVEMKDSIEEGKVIVAEGRINFQEAIKEFDSGLIRNRHLELLCCEGCIMGAGMTSQGKPYAKMTQISQHAKMKLQTMDVEKWKKYIDEFKDINLDREFVAKDQRAILPSEEKIVEVLQKMGKTEEKHQLNCGACGYDTCREHAIAIINGLAETEMCLPYTIEKLHNSVIDLAVSNEKLASVQQALRQSEKLAHMGQLSAGIAHELNNPLGVVIMYSNLMLEECPADSQERKDLELIVQQSERCKTIVSGLLNFARKNKVNFERIKIDELIDFCISSVVIPQNIKVMANTAIRTKEAILDKEQMVQAITNLMKNAVEAMPDGGELKLYVEESNSSIIFAISDNGHGIPKENMDKLFTPFFTTKSQGRGTGLGLATTYGIVKMHKGKITVKSNTDKNKGLTGTTFNIIIPKDI